MKCVNYVKYVKCVDRIYAMDRGGRPIPRAEAMSE